MLRISSSVFHLFNNDYVFEYTRRGVENQQKQCREELYRSLSELDIKSKKCISVRLTRYTPIRTDDCFSVNRDKFLVTRIIEERHRAAIMITNIFKMVRVYKELKRLRLIEHVRDVRNQAALTLQKHFRGYTVRHDIKKILTLKLNDYILFYDYEDLNNKALNIEVKINLGKFKDNLLEMSYSRVLATWYIRFNDIRVLRKRIRVTYLINGRTIIDHKLPVDCEAGNFYNIIESSSLYRKGRRQRRIKADIPYRTWEREFELNGSEKDSQSDFSITEQPDIDKFLKRVTNCSSRFAPKKPLRSILKKTEDAVYKKVTFSHKDYIFHYSQVH
jgi:hypothetical protein